MVTISDDLLPIVRLGVLRFEDVRVAETDQQTPPERDTIQMPTSGAPHERVALVRTMYRRLGVDPTKTRPSSEALLRRLRRGEPLPRINTLVDVCNLCSVEVQLPYGLYDFGRLEGGVALRVGAPGDEYAGIRKQVVHVAGRLALFDERGPFGNPTSDSSRTMVTTATTRALVVVFAPQVVSVDEVNAVLDLTTARVAAATSGRLDGRWVVGS